MIKYLAIFSLLVLPNLITAQEEEDPKKMFRDIVNVQVDRAKYSTPKAKPEPVVEDPKNKKKKKYVEEIPVEPEPDTLPPDMPAPAAEIIKRAQAWYVAPVPSKKFVKSNGSNSGKSVTCSATFIFKQKVLNPESECDGKIILDISIEAKEGKYRYTVKNIKHVATKPGMSGGDIYAIVPECGSMKINDRTWKLIKNESLKAGQIIVDDIKAFMKEEVPEKNDEW
ncbi:MAG: hypothetical protein IPM51_06625 [Sphingobacteriaceae bacterium]|nr:hypothetical protein [Sphingobacteriaceae bacterium]